MDRVTGFLINISACTSVAICFVTSAILAVSVAIRSVVFMRNIRARYTTDALFCKGLNFTHLA